MKRSTDRILVTHAGRLPGLDVLKQPELTGEALTSELDAGVREVVRQQVETGIDIVNDGELSKTNFTQYVQGRIAGIESRSSDPAHARPHATNLRDQRSFPGFYAAGFGRGRAMPDWESWHAAGPMTYVGRERVQADIDRLLAATKGLDVEAYLPAVAPGTIEHWLYNDHYPDPESFLGAIASVMHEEYKAITDAGLVLQIDDPDLPDGWQMYPDITVEDYRAYAELRVEALNTALKGIPEDRVRLHICWGSQHGPHRDDLPLRHIVDLVLKVNVQCYSLEAANPVHEHEWKIWENVDLPDGKILLPGVVGHSSAHIEHPELVAERLIRFASAVGRENVIAGTDCGLGLRVPHPEVCWAKLESLAEGARLASAHLWGS